MYGVLGEQKHTVGVLHGTRGDFCCWQKKYIRFSVGSVVTISNVRPVWHMKEV